MTTVHLYELADARAILDQFLEESEGELTPEIEQLLDELQGDVKEKVERVGLYIREQSALADAIEIEAKRLLARAGTRKRAAEGLKAYLKRQMERLGTTKVEGLLCTVALQRNGQPSVTTELQPNELWALEDARPFVKREEKVVYSIDREALLAAWKAKQPTPASITIEQGTHVRIR